MSDNLFLKMPENSTTVDLKHQKRSKEVLAKKRKQRAEEETRSTPEHIEVQVVENQIGAKMGFIVHPIKSVLKPTQVLIFLGFVLNSVKMTVSLTLEKIKHIKAKCLKLVSNVSITIHYLAEIIGLLVSSFPGVLHGPLFYSNIETDKTTALRKNKGNEPLHGDYKQLFISYLKPFDPVPSAGGLKLL
jgi:hypothetical protein